MIWLQEKLLYPAKFNKTDAPYVPIGAANLPNSPLQPLSIGCINTPPLFFQILTVGMLTKCCHAGGKNCG